MYNGTETYLQNSTVMKWLRQSANAIITTLQLTFKNLTVTLHNIRSNIQKFYMSSHCFYMFCTGLKTATKKLVFITKMESVYCIVYTQSLH